MEGVPATRFATMARFLAAESRQAGLEVPAFRSPPRRPGSPRTIRRMRDGTVVAIQLRGRGSGAVAEDMIEGIVVANRLDAAVTPVEIDLTAEPDAGRNLEARARVAERQTQAA